MSTAHFFEGHAIGQTASLSKTITEAGIPMYSAVSMDTNPVPIDAEAAKESIFSERIAHGMLSAGLIPAVLGRRLPSTGSLYSRQSPHLAAPAKTGDTARARTEVTALNPGKRRAASRTIRAVKDELVIEGETYVRVPSRV